jgi:hypothetical protein
VECPRRYQARDPRAGGLHPLVSEWWPALVAERAESGVTIPGFVERAFEGFLACGVPEAGFVRLRCPDCHLERALAFSCKQRGLCPSCGARRKHDVSAHLMERVFPEVPIRQYVLSPPSELVGLLAYTEGDDGALEFHGDPGPSAEAREALEDEVETRLSGWLGRRGYLDETPKSRPDDGWWLSGAQEPSGVSGGGPRRLRSRFEVNTRVRVRADDRAGRAQLIGYAARPPFAEAQLEVIDEEQVRFTFRSPSRSGQRELVLHPLALLRRLAWLPPPPRQHQVRN